MKDPKDIDYDYDAEMLEREWTGQQMEDQIEKVDPDRGRVSQAQNVLCDLVDRILARTEITGIEVQIALLASFLTLTVRCLTECEYEVFTANRDEALRLLGLVSAQVNEIRPTAEQVAEAPTREILH